MSEGDYTEHNRELQKEFERGCFSMIVVFFTVVAIAIACLLCSCKTCEPIVRTEYRDSVRVVQRLDSVYFYKHDSIFTDRWRSGDTVYITKEKLTIRYKDKLIERTDTITKTETQTETVQVKYVPAFYKWCVGILAVIVFVFLAWVVFKIYKKFYLR